MKVRIKRAYARNTFGDYRAIRVIFRAQDRKGRCVGQKHITMKISNEDANYIMDVGSTEAVGVSATVVDELLPNNVIFDWDVP